MDGAELYYKTEEDPEIKSDSTKNMLDACLNLIDDLSKESIADKDKEVDICEKNIKLWNLMAQAVKNDDKNQLLAPSNTHRVTDLYHYHHHQHFFPYLQIYHLLIYPILFFLFLFLL